MKHSSFMGILGLVVMLLFGLMPAKAWAWDCNYWYQSSDPNSECYRPPADPAPAGMQQLTKQQMAQGQAQGQGQYQLQGQGQTANGEVDVDVGGDQNTYRSRALAISLPGLVAAPAVTGDCRIHTRGIGALSAGVTGGTKLERDCMNDKQCLAIADRYAAVGMFQAMANTLEQCGGVPAKYLPPPPVQVERTSSNPPLPPADTVTREELNAAVRRIEEKLDITFRRAVGK